jgi:hypothetical protein
MRYEVVVQPVAEAKLEQAYRYIWRDAPDLAVRWRNCGRRRQDCSPGPSQPSRGIVKRLFGCSPSGPDRC